jgi:hypothetical protein
MTGSSGGRADRFGRSLVDGSESKPGNVEVREQSSQQLDDAPLESHRHQPIPMHSRLALSVQKGRGLPKPTKPTKPTACFVLR